MESKLVFISHSHHDAAAAKALKNFLAAAFVELRPQTILMTSDHSSGLRSGDLINEQLMQEARDAPVFISILSPIYLHSTYCIAEYAARWGAGKSIHCLRLADLSPAELSGIFAGRHAPLITEEAALWKLLEDIRGANGWKMDALDEMNQTLRALCCIPTTERQDFNAIHKRLLPESTPVFLNAYGLQPQLSSDKVFQDFDCTRGTHNTEPVQFLWADSRPHNWITTELLPSPTGVSSQKESCFLRVRFEHNGGDGCDLSIRPKDEFARQNEGRYLYLDLRIGEDSELERIGVGLRLVNGYMQHWRLHQSKENRLVLPVESTEFGRPLRVDLHHSNWKLFDADGTVDRGPLKPDFSVIASVNLSLGGFEELEQRPTKGSGVLDIHELRLE